MLLVIDIGNTRTKWTLVDDAGNLSPMELCLNTDILQANFPMQQATKVFVANVAGEQMIDKITQLFKHLPISFAQASIQACGVKNRYSLRLGADRWAALIGAWHITKHPTVVVNAGTAITIDALGEANFLGGTIMPGLFLMRQSLGHSTAQLAGNDGYFADFPIDTADAIESGCLNAISGAIHLMLKRLEKQSGWLPKLVISGGDAHKLAQVLNQQVKQVIIAENLVLQGLVLLERTHA